MCHKDGMGSGKERWPRQWVRQHFLLRVSISSPKKYTYLCVILTSGTELKAVSRRKQAQMC